MKHANVTLDDKFVARGGPGLHHRRAGAAARDARPEPPGPARGPEHRRLRLRLSRLAARRARPAGGAGGQAADAARHPVQGGDQRGPRRHGGLGQPAGQPLPRRHSTTASSACGTARRPASTAPATSSSTPTSPGPVPKGGVLAVAGDDHSCKSSTLPSQSEYAFQDFEMPVLAPADVQEVLDYGLLGYALSRYLRPVGRADRPGRHHGFRRDDRRRPRPPPLRDPRELPASGGRPRHPAEGPADGQGAAAAAAQDPRGPGLRQGQPASTARCSTSARPRLGIAAHGQA